MTLRPLLSSRLDPSIVREARDFLESKRIAGVKIQAKVNAVAMATVDIRDELAFRSHLGLLVLNPNYTPAVELFFALEREFRKRTGAAWPTPTELLQLSDKTMALLWGNAIYMRFSDVVMGAVITPRGVAAAPLAALHRKQFSQSDKTRALFEALRRVAVPE